VVLSGNDDLCHADEVKKMCEVPGHINVSHTVTNTFTNKLSLHVLLAPLPTDTQTSFSVPCIL